MSTFDFSNTAFKTAVSFVNTTGRHLFITGKAGTGKTTFLKYIREHSIKKMAVVAPTGVAAINAGGVTIHSFFQLPFGAFVPGGVLGWNVFESGINTHDSLLKNLRLNTAKRTVLRELEMLVIDEVSMVRADLLDAVDTVLRHVRRMPHMPFGGVQMVYIGDLYQLPPVTNNSEWNILQAHYKSPFFFDSLSIKQAPPVYIELKKIYRQSDDVFIDLLNNIRNNCCTPGDLEKLHEYYQPGFTPGKDDGYITLTSHNARADTINQKELGLLPGNSKKFVSKIEGDFPDRAYPAEKEMYLKVGAQIMFIKNDKGEERRYYNGKIATVKKLDNDSITVVFADEMELELEHEVWRNVRFTYNQAEDDIDEEELGTFAQYPIRLAWAITIHKSQGLTFEKAIIDAGASFAAGQVYVALSRLTSLQGLVLLSKIYPSAISTDNRIQDFAELELADDAVSGLLATEQKTFMHQVLMDSFNWNKLMDEVDNHLLSYESRQIPDKDKGEALAKEMLANAVAMHDVADKFIKRLGYLFTKIEDDDYKQLQERTEAASTYFINELEEKILQPLKKHIEEFRIKQKTKKYIKELLNLQLQIQRKQQQVKQAAQLAAGLHQKIDFIAFQQMIDEGKKETHEMVEQVETAKAKAPKGETYKITLQMFKEGKCMADIAAERSLATSTIEGHLAKFVLTGEVDILDLITKEKLERILSETVGEITPSEVKLKLGEDFSYGEIRAAFNFRTFEKQGKQDG